MYRIIVSFAVVSLTSSLVAVGCGDDDDEGGGQTDTAIEDAGRDMAGQDTEAETTPDVAAEIGDDLAEDEDIAAEVFVTLGGTITDILTENVLDSVSVCIFGNSGIPCTTSTNGVYALEDVPGLTRLHVEYAHTDYFPTIVAFETTDEDVDWEVTLASNEAVAVQSFLIGLELDESAGQVAFGVLDPVTEEGVANVGASFSADTGTLVFNGELGLPDPSATETSTAGAGIIANVEPGTYSLTLTPSTGSCSPYLGWEAGGPGTMEVMVVAGFATSVVAYCE